MDHTREHKVVLKYVSKFFFNKTSKTLLHLNNDMNLILPTT